VTTGEITAYDWCGRLSVGIRAGYNISLGLSGKFINQKLDDINALAFGVDVGVKYQSDRLAVAAAVTNIGAGMKERLPTTTRFGIAAYPFFKTFMTSFELEKKVYGGTVIRNGFEMSFSDQYNLHTGYSYYPGHEYRPFEPGISIGAGVQFTWGEVDYAFTPKERYSSETL